MRDPTAILLTALAATVAACTGVVDGDAVEDSVHGIGGHHADPIDPFTVAARIAREGPPRYTSRVHSCPKMRYRTIGNVLASRGVDLTATGELSAGKLYADGAAALAAPNFPARVRENIELGLATSAKLFDLFIQAAPEIIANQPSLPACGGAPLFDAAGHCLADGVSCLIGVPATQAHLDVCDQTVARAADVATGERLAVAVLAAAAHTCE